MIPSLPRRERLFLIALMLAASGMRTMFLVEVHDNPFFNNPTSDAFYYDAEARSVADGDVLGREVFFRAPGYPYWLGLIYYVFGHNYLVVRIIQHALGVAALFLLYLLARRLFGSAVAVVASLLGLFYPVVLYFEGQLLFDWFLTFLCLLWSVLYSATPENRTWGWYLPSLLFGLICVTRPTFLPLAGVIAAYQVWRRARTGGTRPAMKLAMVIAAGLGTAILPVTLRNYAVGKDPVLIASQGGINFFIGNNPAADGFTARMPGDIGASWEISEMTYYVEKQIGHRPTPSEESQFWYERGLQFILHQPLDFLKLLGKKFYLFWNALEIPNNLDFYTFSRYSLLLRVLPVGFWCVGPLGLLGMALAWKSRRGRMLVAFVMMYCAVMCLFFVCDRYRLPVVPFLWIFAAHAMVVFFNLLRRGSYGHLAIHAAPLVVLAGFVNSNLYDVGKQEPVHQEYMLGLIEQKNANYSNAAACFRKASSYGKPIRNLYLHWGECEAALGQDREAVESLHRELAYHPDSYAAWADLSAIFLRDKVLDSVMVCAQRAIALKPFMPQAYVSLGQALYLRHDPVRAESVLTAGSARCGAAFRYGDLLRATILLENGKADSSESVYRSLLGGPPASEGQGYEASYLVSEEKETGIDDRTLRAKAYFGLGHVFVARRQLDSASAYFRAATQQSPALADAWADLGVACLQRRMFTEADSALQRALRLQQDNYMYWYDYGSLLGAMGRFPEARQAFERTLALRPDFGPARADLAFLARAARK